MTPQSGDLVLVRGVGEDARCWVMLGSIVLAEGLNERDAWFRAQATLARLGAKARRCARTWRTL